MQQIADYAKDSRIRLLLQGPPGTGKTTLACQFPGVYVADCDVNLGGPLRWLAKHNRTLPVGYDLIDRDGDKPIEPRHRWERLITCLNTALKEPSIETIVIDSATNLSDIIRYRVLQENKELETLSLPQWGTFFLYWKQLIGRLTSQPKNFILIAHEQTDETGLRWTVAIPGQARFVLGALFSDVWRCEANTARNGDKLVTKYLVRTSPDMNYALKNSLGLDPLIEFSWDKVASAIL
jgi:DNA polymerase III delta prime subunit